MRDYHLSNREDRLEQFRRRHLAVSRERTTQTIGYVYLLRINESHLYKIGFAKDCEKRLRMIQNGQPFALIKLVAAYKASRNHEKALHLLNEKYRQRSVSGGITEWFSFADHYSAVFAFINAEGYGDVVGSSQALEIADAKFDELFWSSVSRPNFVFDDWSMLRNKLYDAAVPFDRVLAQASSLHRYGGVGHD